MVLELVGDVDHQLHKYGARIVDPYRDLQNALRASGFRADALRDRRSRAAQLRRIGALAEARGNLAGAIACYDLALRSSPSAGCWRRLDRLKDLHDSATRILRQT